MSYAVNSVGTTLKKGINTVAELTEINGLDMSADTIDVTTLSSTGGFREFLTNFIDPGEVSIKGFFYPGDTNGQAAIYTAFSGKTIASYTITFPSTMGAAWTFDGYVTKYKTGAMVDNAIPFEATIKVSGEPTLGTTASTGWSAFVLRDPTDATDATADAYVPTISASEYQYAVTFTTETSVRPKVTAASHTIKLYVDDVYVEDLTSGTAGTAIAFGAAGTVKKLTFKMWEDGKTPKYYDMMVHRTS
jgi:predicted secreted protein